MPVTAMLLGLKFITNFCLQVERLGWTAETVGNDLLSFITLTVAVQGLVPLEISSAGNISFCIVFCELELCVLLHPNYNWPVHFKSLNIAEIFNKIRHGFSTSPMWGAGSMKTLEIEDLTKLECLSISLNWFVCMVDFCCPQPCQTLNSIHPLSLWMSWCRPAEVAGWRTGLQLTGSDGEEVK